MAVLTANGAELGTTSLMEVIALTGTIAPSTVQARSGTYSWRANPSAATGFIAEEFYTANTAGLTKHLIWLYIDTLPSSEAVIWSLLTTGDSGMVVITLDDIGVLRARTGGTTAGTQLGSSSVASTGQWISIEVEFDCTTLASCTLVTAVNGVGWLNESGFSIGTAVARRRLGVQTASITADLYVDDLIIVDGATVIDRLTRLVDIPVASDADTGLRGTQGTNWQTGPSTGGTAYQQISEHPTPDDASSYVALLSNSAGSASAPILDFGLADPASYGIGASDTIAFLEVNTRHRAASASNTADVIRLKGQSGGTVTESGSLTFSSTNWLTNRETAARQNSRLISLSNPQDGSAWTRATVTTAIVGVRSGDTNPNPWTTKIWVTVAFITATGGGGGGAKPWLYYAQMQQQMAGF